MCFVKTCLWFVASVLYLGTGGNGSFVVSDTWVPYFIWQISFAT